MPKRLPGGKVKRGTKPARARAPQPRPVVTGADADAPTRPAYAAPAAVRHPAEQTRPSLLSTVRRAAPKSGPALVTDYSYVRSDLRRIAIVSAGAFVILIILSFVIR